ncbi:hypothetical protein [Kitasatospora sp. NPDC089509]|uniref:hypothetical protein n=1 Tax=Kitasatospora sp. NPDC089509 TaxID=3364079 RepID=UPI0037F7FE1C
MDAGPTGEHLGDVLVALAPACPLIVFRPPTNVSAKFAARLDSHFRTNNTVVLAYDNPWPSAQLHLAVVEQRWSGLGDGYGILDECQVRVECTGRRTRGRTRTAELLLPDREGTVSQPTRLLFDGHRSVPRQGAIHAV